MIWPHSKDEFMEFLDLLNSQRESIKFKHEISENSIDFLDLTIFKGQNFEQTHILDTKVYFKPTNTLELLHKTSHHPKHTFKGVIKSQLIRYYRNCTNREDFEEACSKLFKALRSRRGYSQRYLRSIKSQTIQNLEKENGTLLPHGASMRCNRRACECCLYIKETSEFYTNNNDIVCDIEGKLDCNSKNIVYLITCERCSEAYVGETSRPLRVRLNNHVSNIRLNKNTQVAEHFNQLDHLGQLDLSITPICQVSDTGSKLRDQILRRNCEAYFIKVLGTMVPDGMNKKIEKSGIMPFPIIYGSTSAKVTKIVKEFYDKLQERFPKYFNDKLVIAYKRNKNIKDLLVSSKLV